ncbi:MAG TPA: LEA type 2 family protein [Steroidobacteraceae bacterium]|nr:LEA type 2 family protein [Steroidobacteraceae bacterium]
MTHTLRLVALTLAAALLGGCALTRLQAPDITPTSVELVDAGITEQHFKVGLHVQNPNDRALPIKSVHCALQIEGVEVGSGESVAPFNVPAHGESDFDMLISTNLATSVPNLAMRLFRGGQMPSYRLSGSVNPDITLLPPIPFSKSGQLTLPN